MKALRPCSREAAALAPCEVHDQVVAGGVCRTCLGEFCDECLVYTFGTSKPPHCMGCALEAVATHPVPTV